MRGAIRRKLPIGADMNTKYDHASNDSPRSGSSKQVTPVVWFIIIACVVAFTIWLGIKA
jgi:hypothetical protein